MLPDLKKVGFDLEQVNATTFIIHGTPADMAGFNAVDILEKMLENYKINRTDLNLDRKLGIAKTMALQLAVKASTALTELEMQDMADRLFGCSVAEVAPDGRKIYAILTLDEINGKLKTEN